MDQAEVPGIPFKHSETIPESNATEEAVRNAISEGGGKIPYSEFMRLSLYGPDGYYSSAKVKIGQDAENELHDFQTSPGTSEAFGATIGNTLRQTWEAMGKPEIFQIIEMGAGEGTLAESLLSWSEKLYPDFYKTIRYNILEIGELITKQQKRISTHHPIKWIQGSAYELPFANVEGAFISNELVDAFPIELVTLKDGKLRQKYVTVKNGQLIEQWDEPNEELKEYISEYELIVAEDDITTVNLNSVRLQKQIDRALTKGSIITIDYGGKTLRPKKVNKAVRFYSNKLGEPNFHEQYENVGEMDITADVDFFPLEMEAKKDGLQIAFSGSQSDFLLASGLVEVRAAILEHIRNVKSWKEVLRIFDTVSPEKVSQILAKRHLGNYYAHVLTKGIHNTVLSALTDRGKLVDRLNSQPIEFPIRLGEVGSKVYAHFNLLPFVRYRLDDVDKQTEGPMTQQFILNDKGRLAYTLPPALRVNGDGTIDSSFDVLPNWPSKNVQQALVRLTKLEHSTYNGGTLTLYDAQGNLLCAFGDFKDHPQSPEEQSKLEEEKKRHEADIIEETVTDEGDLRESRETHLQRNTQQDLEELKEKAIESSGYSLD